MKYQMAESKNFCFQPFFRKNTYRTYRKGKIRIFHSIPCGNNKKACVVSILKTYMINTAITCLTTERGPSWEDAPMFFSSNMLNGVIL